MSAEPPIARRSTATIRWSAIPSCSATRARGVELDAMALAVVDRERRHLEAGGLRPAAAVAESSPPESSTTARSGGHASPPASARARSASSSTLVPSHLGQLALAEPLRSRRRIAAACAARTGSRRAAALHVLDHLPAGGKGVADQHLVAPGRSAAAARSARLP